MLIISTVIVNRQMSYMLGGKLGFKKDHVIEIKQSFLLGNKSRAFRTQLSNIAGVESVGASSSMPGDDGFFGVSWREINSRQTITGKGLLANDQLASTLGLQMAEGRFFSSAFATDSLSIILNERAVAAMGLHEPVIGTRLVTTDEGLNGRQPTPTVFTVIGVLKDFHFQTLHQQIVPLFVTNVSKFNDITNVTSVRIQGDRFASTLGLVEKSWNEFVPERPFQYSFLDQNLAAQYKAEQTMQRVFTVFSILAIFIACIGLLGLAAYATQQRIREISIRKVLGASVPGIITMLSKDFLKLVTISALVAFPLAWYAMHNWLEGFAYRVGISWWIFLLAWLASVVIALLTISFQALKAARTNPIKVLRSE